MRKGNPILGCGASGIRVYNGHNSSIRFVVSSHAGKRAPIAVCSAATQQAGGSWYQLRGL
jgi:hypothetical protein